MIKDAKELAAGDEIQADIVIVGTGAGGMAAAVELIDSGQTVIVLEAGKENFDATIQSVYDGEVTESGQHGHLSGYRRRMLGGTSNVWGGRCSSFVDSDFTKRDYVANSGWPIEKSQLDPFYIKAHKYCDIGNYDYTVKGSLAGDEKIVPDLKSDKIGQDQIWRFSLPTNFGTKFKLEVAQSENVTLYLNASCVHIQLDDAGKEVKWIDASSNLGCKFKIKGKKFIIAAGGLETTRLLLASNDVENSGIGGTSGNLGKYYSSHLTGNYGEVKLSTNEGAVSWKYKTTKDGVYYKQQLRVLEAEQDAKGLLNTRIILSHPGFGDPSHGSGVLSGAYLVKRFLKGQIPPEYSKDLASSEYKHVGKHVKNVILDSPKSMAFAFDWIRRRVFSKRKLPSIALRSKSNVYTLHYDSEQTPVAESIITLCEDKDMFGMPKLNVDWRFDKKDLDNLFETYKTIATELEETGAGVMLSTDDEVRARIKNQIGVGSHHLGSTRMSANMEEGVVDINCKVHTVANLYLASPSVFCTGGFANPFLTIVALALRIADHLQRKN
jgi:choline dehydrogenase-like flavoprotein